MLMRVITVKKSGRCRRSVGAPERRSAEPALADRAARNRCKVVQDSATVDGAGRSLERGVGGGNIFRLIRFEHALNTSEKL